MMRKYARKAFRFMDAYRRKCSVHLAVYATRKYRGHRMLPSDLTLEIIKVEYKQYMEKLLLKRVGTKHEAGNKRKN
jgi:hypothetical protein